jgi:iron complex outermembrane recepter protein
MVAYVNVGTSYRPGGVTVAAANLGNLTEYNEEDSWSLEVGLKSKWLDNRLRLNAAVFHQDYSDYIGRVSRVKINTGASASITTNGDATVQGIELDGEYLLSENWHLAGSLSYNEAEYKDGAQIPCNGPTIVSGEVAALCDVGGLELGTQPRFSASISSNYSVPFDLFEGYVSGLYKFTGRRTDVDAASGDLGGYGTMDLHLGARDYDGQWDISVFARNLFDKDATESIQPELRTLSGLDNGYLKANQIMPRLIGVSATYNF